MTILTENQYIYKKNAETIMMKMMFVQTNKRNMATG